MSPGGVRNRQPPQVLDNTYLKGLLKGDIKVTKLNRDNYQSWARNMRISLDAKLLWDLVKGTIPEPDVRIRPNDHRAWWIDNNHAKMWINNNLEEDQQTHCSEEERYAHNIWMTLYKVHGVDSQGRMMMLKRKFYTYKARTDETIDEIASELTRIRLLIRNIRSSEAPSDFDVAMCLMNAVDHEQYEFVKLHLEEDNNLTLEYAKQRLRTVEQKLVDKGQKEIANKVLTTLHGLCFHCHKPGHFKTECPEWLKTDAGKSFSKRKAKEGSKEGEEGTKANKSENGSGAPPRKKPGKTKHRRKGNARQAQEEQENEASESEDDEEIGFMIKEWNGRSEEILKTEVSEEILETVVSDENLETVVSDKARKADIFIKTPRGDRDLGRWIIDSGASRHMTPDRKLFTKFRNMLTSVTIADGTKLSSPGRGDISVDLGGKKVRMENVLWVPRLDSNLLSIKALNRKGLSILFRPEGVEITRDGTSVATGFFKGNMFLLRNSEVALETGVQEDQEEQKEQEEQEVPQEVQTRELVGTQRSEPRAGPSKSKSEQGKISAYLLWHSRLGHVSARRIQLLSKKIPEAGKAIDIEGTPLSFFDKVECSVCNYTKMTRAVYRVPPRRVDRKLGRAYSDVWGPYRITSLNGYRYFINFVDEFTRKSWLELMKSRKEVQGKVLEWKKVAEVDSGETLAKLRTDNAKEFEHMANNLRKEGVVMEFTTPHTPEENGMAERLNRTIIQMARAMLHWAELPKTFWGEAAKTANYLRNVLPLANNQPSPDEQWYGYAPVIDHIRTFGCLVHAHVPSASRAKLDRVSFQGIFVGYHSHHQFRIYNPKSRRIGWHTSVKFLEDTPGGTLLKPPTKPEQWESDQENQSDDDSDDSDQNESSQSHHSPSSGPTGRITHGQSLGEDVPEAVGDREVVPLTDPNNSDKGADVLPNTPKIGTVRSSDAPKSKRQGKTLVQKSKPKGREIEQPIRRSTRTTKPYDRYAFDNEQGRSAINNLRRIPEPRTFQEAIHCQYKRWWIISIKDELHALIANGTWIIVRLPPDRRAITSKWVFKVKYTPTGLVDRFKARLVARGFTQKYGFDYEETFSPTLRMESLRMLLSLAIRFGLYVEQMDVPNAYLRGDLDEEVYMEIPEGLDLPPNTPKGMVLRLLKGLYGLKQSGRIWNKKIKAFLISIGFIQLTADNCVYINHSTKVIISLYVDDLLIFSRTMAPINSVKKQLHEEYNMKDLGPVKQILGIRVRKEESRLALDQTQYINNFLKEYSMDEARTVQTPIDGYEALTPARPEEERTNQLDYQKRIGSAMYAMIGTRPDIAFAVGKLSQFSHDPTIRHMNALNRVLRYLKGTTDLALIYESDNTSSTPVCYADAAYGDDKVDRKSTYGTVMMMGGGAVMWTSKKQRTTSTSTTEAEYVALCHASKDIV